MLCETKSWTRSSKRGSLASMGSIVNELDLVPTGSKLQIYWPRLKCCDSHDYCNADVTDHANKNDRRSDHLVSRNRGSSRFNVSSRLNSTSFVDPRTRLPGAPKDRNQPIESPPASASTGYDRAASTSTIETAESEDQEESYDPLRHRIRPLHVAAVVLAIAALTSVLAACYVITRFTNSLFNLIIPFPYCYVPAQLPIDCFFFLLLNVLSTLRK